MFLHALCLLCSSGSPEGCNGVQLLEHGSLQTPDAGLDACAAHAAEDGQDWRVVDGLKSLATDIRLSEFMIQLKT